MPRHWTVKDNLLMLRKEWRKADSGKKLRLKRKEFFPKPLHPANSRQLTPTAKENIFSFRVIIERCEAVMHAVSDVAVL